MIGPCVSAQDLKWNEGSIVLASGMVLTGQISMAPGQNLILFRKAETSRGASLNEREQFHNGPTAAEALPAYRLTSVFFYDEEANINRRYVAVGDRKVFPGTQLYETVIQGKLDVLRRPRSFSVTATDAKDYDYYCRDNDTLVPLWKFYSDIYPSLEDASRQHLAAFIKANNLQKGNDGNLIRIIGYYNKLIRSEEALARY